MTKTKKPLPGRKKGKGPRRTHFARSDLPEVYRMRHYLDGGERPGGRAYARNYSELAEAFNCSESLAAAACAQAEALFRTGGLVQIGTMFALSRPGEVPG